MNETRFDPVAPLILLCPPRSFSTVVCAMLGQHPELYGFPELNLFVVDTVKELLELDGSYSAGVVRVLEEVQPASAEQAMLWLQVRRE